MSESEKYEWTTRFLNIIFEKEVTSTVDGKHQQNIPLPRSATEDCVPKHRHPHPNAR